MKLNAINIGSLQGQMVQQSNTNNAINSNPLHNSNANNSADSFQNSNSSKNVSFKGLRTFLRELLESDSEKYARAAEKRAREVLIEFNALKSDAAKLGISTAEFTSTEKGLSSLKYSIWFEELKPKAQKLGVPVTKNDDFNSLNDKVKFANLKIAAKNYNVKVEPNDTYETLDAKVDKCRPRHSESEPSEGYSAPDGRDPSSPYDM